MSEVVVLVPHCYYLVRFQLSPCQKSEIDNPDNEAVQLRRHSRYFSLLNWRNNHRPNIDNFEELVSPNLILIICDMILSR